MISRKLVLVSLALSGWIGLSTEVRAKISVVTTIPDLAWAAEEIGGSDVEVTSLLEGTENAHFVDAVPEFIRVTANADVLCTVGLDLEIGWIPKVMSKSGNAQIQKGGKGYCNLGQAVEPLEKLNGPADRSMGHVHPSGNPHYWLAPNKLAQASEHMVEVFSQVDPKNEKEYAARYKKFADRLNKLESRLKDKLRDAMQAKNNSPRSPAAIQYHSDFSYFLDAYGLKSFGSIEEKPGVKPSFGRIATVASSAKKADVKVALALDTDPTTTLNKFSELSAIPVLRLSASIRPAAKDENVKTYPALQEHYIQSIISKIAD